MQISLHLNRLAKFIFGAIVLLVSQSVGAPLLAQQTVTSASLSGRITDPGGAAVSGASLTATNPETNQKLTTTSNSDGRYYFPYLQVGTYTLDVSAAGFARLNKQL